MQFSVPVQVLSETKQLCTSAVEPIISSVDSVKQYSVDKVVMRSSSQFIERNDRTLFH